MDEDGLNASHSDGDDGGEAAADVTGDTDADVESESDGDEDATAGTADTGGGVGAELNERRTAAGETSVSVETEGEEKDEDEIATDRDSAADDVGPGADIDGDTDGDSVADSDSADPGRGPDSDAGIDSEVDSGADDGPMPGVPDPEPEDSDVPEDVRKYARFKKMDGAQYERVNDFLRDRTYITAREWAIARLCSDFRTETGVEMTKIGENLPELVPFMTDTYTPQAVNQARSSFEEKVRKAGATFLYGAMCDFFTAEELDDVMYESTEVAKFLLEVEGVDLSVEEELEAEERISSVMREVREASEELRAQDGDDE